MSSGGEPERPRCPRCGAPIARAPLGVLSQFCGSCGYDLHTPPALAGPLERATDWWGRQSGRLRLVLLVIAVLLLVIITLASLRAPGIATPTPTVTVPGWVVRTAANRL